VSALLYTKLFALAVKIDISMYALLGPGRMVMRRQEGVWIHNSRYSAGVYGE